MIVGVLLPLPFNEPFDYQIDGEAVPGELVRVSFGREVLVGAVWKLGKSSNLNEDKIKFVTERINLPPLEPELMKFIDFVASYNMAYLGLVLKMVLSVKGVFEDPKMNVLYELSGKTLAEAKLKNSDARWRVIKLLEPMPLNRREIAAGAGVGQPVIKTLIDAGVLQPVLVEDKRQFGIPDVDFQKIKLNDSIYIDLWSVLV